MAKVLAATTTLPSGTVYMLFSEDGQPAVAGELQPEEIEYIAKRGVEGGDLVDPVKAAAGVLAMQRHHAELSRKAAELTAAVEAKRAEHDELETQIAAKRAEVAVSGRG